jgi:hypothetical protein
MKRLMRRSRLAEIVPWWRIGAVERVCVHRALDRRTRPARRMEGHQDATNSYLPSHFTCSSRLTTWRESDTIACARMGGMVWNAASFLPVAGRMHPQWCSNPVDRRASRGGERHVRSQRRCLKWLRPDVPVRDPLALACVPAGSSLRPPCLPRLGLATFGRPTPSGAGLCG